VLEVSEDRFGDMGYEDKNGKFIDIFESNLAQQEFPYTMDGWLKPLNTFATALPKVIGVTVNKVSGTEESAKLLHQKYRADIETMEGAAFFLVCMLNKIPCIQIKSVSNYVEARDKSKWDIPLAVKNLNTTVRDIIKGIAVQG
jgi:futalosine hydrolase